jgi:hypothetical protein
MSQSLGPKPLASEYSLMLSAACYQSIAKEADTAFKPLDGERWQCLKGFSTVHLRLQ